ncbi:glycine--tRNA ligase subunit beta [Bacillus kwashiorkori]|uniref:glycine--tRNA ligase subunit beta n=1 Tax=Bacillus kwashiorkori TaxID=1522318 RepID=UPI000786100E|nr:glycine--tRNA ligase subunit beta [Bacillus kwashiorkori]
MTTRDFLLEIGLEEMPARFITNAMNQLGEQLKQFFTTNKISFGEVITYSTPRRLAVLIKDLAESQKDMDEEVKGPAKKIAIAETGEWTKAAIGFTRGQGVTVDNIYFKEINGIEYVHVKKFIKGKETKELLPEIVDIITHLSFPKNMRWTDYSLRYVRPIRWIVSLFGNEIIPITINDVTSNNRTKGHRFLGTEVEISEPSKYKETLLAQYVLVDYNERKQAIIQQLHSIETENDCIIPVDEELLEEVTNLVEYPTALVGNFSEEFLQLPSRVLITTMKEHQRYFPVQSKTGELLPQFVTIRNGDHRHLDTVKRGNEKVLRARLQDAVFFYKEDQKLGVKNALERLSNVVFHEEIGTYQDKINRIRRLTDYLLENISVTTHEEQAAKRASEICKFDLVTQMVNEFPELQGFMGEKYAMLSCEQELVAIAINEHYMPRFSGDALPETEAGAIVSIADKLDTIASFFAINLIPSGSQDPYSLRRLATGVVQILKEKAWNINFIELLKFSIKNTKTFANRSENEILTDCLAFFRLRFKYLLQEEQIRYDIIDAVLAAPINNVKSIVTRAELLNEKKDEDNFKENIETLSRVINISKNYDDEIHVDTKLFKNQFEQKLYEKFVDVKAKLNNIHSESQYYELLISMQQEINDYFDHTMVNVQDAQLRKTRLSLTKSIANLILDFASLQNLIVK